MSEINTNLFTRDGQPISTAAILEWLQADYTAQALLKGYLTARKSGRVAKQGLNKAHFSAAGHTSNNDFA